MRPIDKNAQREIILTFSSNLFFVDFGRLIYWVKKLTERLSASVLPRSLFTCTGPAKTFVKSPKLALSNLGSFCSLSWYYRLSTSLNSNKNLLLHKTFIRIESMFLRDIIQFTYRVWSLVILDCMRSFYGEKFGYFLKSWNYIAVFDLTEKVENPPSKFSPGCLHVSWFYCTGQPGNIVEICESNFSS